MGFFRNLLFMAIIFLSSAFLNVQSFSNYKGQIAYIGTRFRSVKLFDTPTENTSQASFSQVPTKRVAIGSQPEFALPDDSTIETPHQRAVFWAHWIVTALNICTAGCVANYSCKVNSLTIM